MDNQIIKTQKQDLATSETVMIRFQGQQRLLEVQDIQNLHDIVKREIFYPKLNDKEHGSSEREKVTKRLVSMLQMKFDPKPAGADENVLSPQELAMAEFGSYIRRYQLTAEEVIEAYRMGVDKKLLDTGGNIIQVYPNLSIIQAGEVLNAYLNYKAENSLHTNGIKNLKLLLNPEKQISPEEAKENRKKLLQELGEAVKNDKPCGHSFLFYDFVVRKGGFKCYLSNADAQKIVLQKKMREVMRFEKMKVKSTFFNSYELAQFSEYFETGSEKILEDMHFSFERLKSMAITQVKNDLVYGWFKKQYKKKQNN
ncbi:TPA: hypothetical protein ACG0AP_003582 [Elizabethkingia anophelis]